MTDTWNPTQYDRFQREREQPFADLTAMIRPEPGMRIVDLGCGTGKLTRDLHTQLAARETVGIDRSLRMLERASAGPLPPGLRFEATTIEAFVSALPEPSAETGERYDLIFANASLHWVDHHEMLLQRLALRCEAAASSPFRCRPSTIPSRTSPPKKSRDMNRSRPSWAAGGASSSAGARGLLAVAVSFRLRRSECPPDRLSSCPGRTRGRRGMGEGDAADRIRASPVA